MTPAALDDEGFAPLGPFELEVEEGSHERTVLAALTLVGRCAHAAGDARGRACAALAAAWAEAGAAGPERDALAGVASPTTEALRRRLALEVQTGRWADAARSAEALTAFDDAPERRAEAWRRWVAAGSIDDARRIAREGDPARVAMVYLARSADGEAVLRAAAEAAERAGDAEGRRSYAVDAWIESGGARGGAALVDALLGAGRPEAAMYVELEEAARAYIEGGAGELALRSEPAPATAEGFAVWTLRSLLPGEGAAAARETLRDLLADQGRAAELAVRLRVDAWAAPQSSRAAAWKGVAAMELPHDPLLATRALVEGLRAQPDDAEALALLRMLAAEPSVESATRDAAWGLVRMPEIGPERRAELLLWLGALEEAAGDLAAAESAYAGVQGAVPQAFEGLSRVYEGAARQVAEAEAAFGALAASPEAMRAVALEQAVARCASTPGALSAAGSALETLAAFALDHEGAAALWVRAARRSPEAGNLPAVLRRLATRSSVQAVRREALLECLTLPALSAGGGSDVAELLGLYLEELPGDATIAAALAALAEQRGDDALVRDAVRAVARATADPAARDVLLRFAGERGGVFEALAAAAEEPVPSVERGDRLRRLHELVGDSVTLLALRTRALMASSGAPGEAVAVARRFVAAAPWSPEAAFAYAALARLGGDGEEIVAAIGAALRSCARLPELASLVRGAVARLAELGDESSIHHALDAATEAGLLADHALAELAGGAHPRRRGRARAPPRARDRRRRPARPRVGAAAGRALRGPGRRARGPRGEAARPRPGARDRRGARRARRRRARRRGAGPLGARRARPRPPAGGPPLARAVGRGARRRARRGPAPALRGARRPGRGRGTPRARWSSCATPCRPSPTPRRCSSTPTPSGGARGCSTRSSPSTTTPQGAPRASTAAARCATGARSRWSPGAARPRPSRRSSRPSARRAPSARRCGPSSASPRPPGAGRRCSRPSRSSPRRRRRRRPGCSSYCAAPSSRARG